MGVRMGKNMKLRGGRLIDGENVEELVVDENVGW